MEDLDVISDQLNPVVLCRNHKTKLLPTTVRFLHERSVKSGYSAGTLMPGIGQMQGLDLHFVLSGTDFSKPYSGTEGPCDGPATSEAGLPRNHKKAVAAGEDLSRSRCPDHPPAAYYAA